MAKGDSQLWTGRRPRNVHYKARKDVHIHAHSKVWVNLEPGTILILFNNRELEKFMSYGFFHCLDSFLFIFTFLPLRMFLAVVTLFLRIPLTYLGIAA